MWTATTKREAALQRPHAGGRGGGNSDWKAYHSGFACGGQVSESKGCLLFWLIRVLDTGRSLNTRSAPYSSGPCRVQRRCPDTSTAPIGRK